MNPSIPFLPVVGNILVDAFQQSDWLGQGIVIVLIGVSLYVLSVVVDKFLSLRGFKSYNLVLLGAYKRHPHPTFSG